MNEKYREIKTKNKQFLVYQPYILNDPDAIVIVSHGMAEHGQRYDELASFLNKKNILMYAIDHIGHGVNENQLGVWPEKGFFRCINHLKYFIGTVKRENPNKKIILLGHSMGSFIVLGLLPYHGYLIDQCILSGSRDKNNPLLLGLGILIAKIQIFMGKGNEPSYLLDKMTFGSFNKHFKPTKTSFDWLSKDEQRVKEYVDDPYCGFVCSKQLFLEFFKGLSFIFRGKNLKRIPKDLHIHIFSGQRDPVGSFGKGPLLLQKRLKKSGVTDVTLQIYPENRHECLNEINREQVMNDLYQIIYSGILSS